MRFRILGAVLGLAAGFACGVAWQGARESDPGTSTATSQAVLPARTPALVQHQTQAQEPSLHVDSTDLAGRTTGVPATAAVRTGPVAVDDADQAVSRAETSRVLLAGTEAERFDVLRQAVETGLDLPAGDLIEIFQTDPSDPVALLAFSAHVDSVAEDASATREALARGLESGNAAVREDATRRMLEMESLARAQANTPVQGPQ